MLLLLATKSILARPWCLFELHEAATHRIPVVVVQVRGEGSDFDLDDARELVGNLEERLEQLNPGAVAKLRDILGSDDLQPLQSTLRALLSAADQADALQWHPHASAEACAAAARDICERMAQATHQRLVWQSSVPIRRTLPLVSRWETNIWQRSGPIRHWVVCAAPEALRQAETLRSGLARVASGATNVCVGGYPGDAQSVQAFDGLAVLLTAEVLHSSDVLLLVRCTHARPRSIARPSASQSQHPCYLPGGRCAAT